MKSCTILKCSICLCFPHSHPCNVLHAHYRLSYGGILLGKLFNATIPKTNERLEPCLTSVVSCWRIPIFPGRLQPSIVGTTELNFCVRNGNRWTLCVNLTNFLLYLSLTTACSCNRGNRLLSGCTFRDSNPGPTD